MPNALVPLLFLGTGTHNNTTCPARIFSAQPHPQRSVCGRRTEGTSRGAGRLDTHNFFSIGLLAFYK